MKNMLQGLKSELVDDLYTRDHILVVLQISHQFLLRIIWGSDVSCLQFSSVKS